LVVIRLNGGLGNQLFQYATGYAVALKNQQRLKLDVTGFSFQNFNSNQSYRNLDILDFEIELYETISGSELNRLRYPLGFLSKINNFIKNGGKWNISLR
jgi:hypothetical protein